MLCRKESNVYAKKCIDFKKVFLIIKNLIILIIIKNNNLSILFFVCKEESFNFIMYTFKNSNNFYYIKYKQYNYFLYPVCLELKLYFAPPTPSRT